MNQQQYNLSLVAYHHVQSFNYLYQQGLQNILQRFIPLEISEKDFQLEHTFSDKLVKIPFKLFKLSFTNLQIGKPYRKNDSSLLPQIYPQECRLAGKTYTASFSAEMVREIDGNVDNFTVQLGQIPIMVGSTNCHLHGLTKEQLIDLNEDPNQFGGYFIINGNQKMIRMLIIQKKNYPVAFIRSSYLKKGTGFTEFAVQMRCVRDDLYAKTLTLHYIADGNIYLRLLHKKQQFLIPIIILLKAIYHASDRSIYLRLLKAQNNNTNRSDKIQVLIAYARNIGLYTQSQFLEYLGKNFRIMLGISAGYTDRQAGKIFLIENICPHIDNLKDKFNTICLLIDKLYDLAEGQIKPQNLDSISVHESLLPGHLYSAIVREKLQQSLGYIRTKIMKDAGGKQSSKIITLQYLKKCLEGGIIGKNIEYFLSTGNIKSKTGLDLMQDKGFCILADRLNNMRFLSHFRSIHRGTYFAQMKTTTVRKLLPQCWGFLCPVHTPDGGPCGLLNHITKSCCPLPKDPYQNNTHVDIESLCVKNGMILISDWDYIENSQSYPVMINGKHMGYIEGKYSEQFVQSIKIQKVSGLILPKETEVAYLKNGRYGNTIFPMIFITTAAGRFLRPVQNLALGNVEWITPLEQLFLDIDLKDSQYSEISSTNILSILPQHIPFLNYNQSPRNMYQCQMAKQTLGTSILNWDYRFDNKLYRILHSQNPLVQSKFYEKFKFSDYNSGTNAVVAVISYTGYDMEDAMIINKSSYQNGFGHGCIYKTVQYQMNKQDKKKLPKYKLFKDAPLQMQKLFELPEGIQSDGISGVGCRLKKFGPILVLFDTAKRSFKTFYNKQSETCYVQSVILIGSETKNTEKVIIKLRIDRRPIIGDKFSSRHGQKGVLSMLWPKIDMPFTQTGMTPDIIINPHAFPSRMTIGMLIQSMAAKSAALQGEKVTYEAFQAYENDNVIHHFGKKLHEHGFNFYGNETMYSGTYGSEFKVDIFIGLVYYQRLRHMINDKSQARSTGPVDILTQQPLKGRKKGGGIRMGEMQRDAMLAHGVSQIINERLFRSSDKSQGFICNKCGLMLSCYQKVDKISGQSLQQVYKFTTVCRNCQSKDCSLVPMPYVMKYLVNELATMNIRLRFKLAN